MDNSGVALTEFALILPFLLVLFLGGVNLTEGVMAQRKVTLVASTVSDLVAQVKNVDENYAARALMAGTSIIAPFDSGELSSVVSSVMVDDKGKATVTWSLGKNATPRKKGSTFPLPPTLKVPNTSVVAAEVGFEYKPTIGYAFTGTFTMTETSFAKPRLAVGGSGISCSALGC